jgi:Glycosyl transferase family 2
MEDQQARRPPAAMMTTSGWPWTNTPATSPPELPDGAAWPRISIVTPSLNQASFLEETIRSVLMQGYPNLEYIVIDGGSTDESLAVIRRYAKYLAYWVSEPDRGQSQAINKGFERATGELFGWLNSDDLYFPGALATVARAYHSAPGALVAASVVSVDERPGRVIPDQTTRHAGLSFERLVRLGRNPLPYHQPGLFFPAQLWRELKGLDERLKYTMDYDLLCRLLQACSVVYVPDVVARFRLHGQSKTCSQWLSMVDEQVGVARKYAALAGAVDERALEQYVVEGLVSQFGTELFRGHPTDAVAMLSMAFRTDPALAVAGLVRQFAGGLARHTVRIVKPTSG